MLTLSKSRLNTFVQCPEKYKARYELEIKPLKKSGSLLEGQAIHHLIESGLMIGSDAGDVLIEASQEFWGEVEFETTDYMTKDTFHHAQKTCLEEGKKFLQMIGPLAVESVETHIEVPLIDPRSKEPIFGLSLQGYIDLIDRVDRKHRVIDIKTSSRKQNGNPAKLSLELTAYAYLLDYPFDTENDELRRVAFLNLIRTKQPQVIWDESERSIDEYIELVETCMNVSHNILNGWFWKNPGTHCTWCDYLPLCNREDNAAKAIFGREAFDRYLMNDFLPSEPKAVYCR